MLTPAAFLQLFPEFAGQTNPLLVQAKLQLAAARMGGPDYTVWGQPSLTPGATPSIADQAQAYLAAHLLMASPFGTSTLLAQPKDGSGKSEYLRAFEELELSVAGGFAVAGSVV